MTAITATAALAATGAQVDEVCSAIRADLSGLHRHPTYVPIPSPHPEEHEVPFFAALIRNMEVDLSGADRLLAMAQPVLKELLRNAKMSRFDVARCGLLVAAPESESSADLAAQLVERLELKETFALVETHRGGHDASLQLVQNALSAMDASDLDRCLIVGVDSYHDETRLRALDEAKRLRSRRTRDGFAPGEGAAGVLLEPLNGGRRHLAVVDGVGTSTEPQPIEGRRHSTAAGLTEAIRALPSADEPVGVVWCDLNGERYRFFEWGLAKMRANDVLAADVQVCHPADCVGDVGAATGALLMACAVHDFARDPDAREHALLFCGADDGRRTALRLSKPASTEEP